MHAKMTTTATTPRAVPASSGASGLNLRAGEWVQVRDAAEIMATLDETQSLENMPFMPEMLQFCGKQFRVYKSAHKTCDTIHQYVIRRMTNTVHLEGLRCDGGAHGGCQASCLLFWKDAWLKRVQPGAAASKSTNETVGMPCDVEPLYHAARLPKEAGEEQERYRCQATEVVRATTEVRKRDRWDPRFYLKDLTSGNVTLRNFIWFGAIAVANSFTLRWRGRRYPHLCGQAGDKTPHSSLNLQPGEMVQVRSKEEIMKTLNSSLRNRGLSFDVEMVPYCEAGTFKVLDRIEKIVDEKTGRLIKLPNACIILDGVTCGGNLSTNRMFCPRAVYPYWREGWLKRSDQAQDAGQGAPASR
jgi:hypothetical protein